MNEEFFDFEGGPLDGGEAYFGINPPKTKTVYDRGSRYHYRLSDSDDNGERVYVYVKTTYYDNTKTNTNRR